MIEPIKEPGIRKPGKPHFTNVEITHRTNNTQEHKIVFTQEEVFMDKNGKYTITQKWEPKDPPKLDVKA